MIEFIPDGQPVNKVNFAYRFICLP